MQLRLSPLRAVHLSRHKWPLLSSSLRQHHRHLLLSGLGTRWSHWLGIGAIGLVDQSTGGANGSEDPLVDITASPGDADLAQPELCGTGRSVRCGELLIGVAPTRNPRSETQNPKHETQTQMGTSGQGENLQSSATGVPRS